MDFKKNLNKEIKVAQFSGYVSENSAYHHGEASLQGAIINMAQDFVGSGNNINLLLPNGQFGTRLQGGKDSASPRYIFTELNPITRKIFINEDDDVLNYLDDDGLYPAIKLMSFLMLEVSFLGKYLGINPFDQPAVEKVKLLTKKLLMKNE